MPKTDGIDVGAVISTDFLTPGLFIDANQAGDHPRALGQLLPCALMKAIQVGKTIALGEPDQAAILEKAIAIGEVDPTIGRGALRK